MGAIVLQFLEGYTTVQCSLSHILPTTMGNPNRHFFACVKDLVHFMDGSNYTSVKEILISFYFTPAYDEHIAFLDLYRI